MFDSVIAYSIKQKFIVGLFVLALIFVGLNSLVNLPIDALPDITNNQVQILTTSPNLATQEVELFITYPIELAIKSIPKIVELRSVSRFGLSIVTVVFQEDVDIYWARSQITERLKQAEDQIPEGFGTPELAPISTGLGEIFQYTVEAADGYEDKYSIMDLRSIQDWIIVPQLIGTKGVAEVNTLGGILKEYEVAVNPDKLKSMGVTMAEIFSALKSNNENTGGAYIDKKPYAYFIRSLGKVNSLDDISKIVIKTNNNIPILIKDVAEVQFGNTVRYGATTKDGKGEVVNGMVMMLKGENSAEIVSLVKEKMQTIRKTLPEGISIVPYLDRSKLVNRTIATVRTNLIEGALIVIFILVLLIGNWRAGLIVASVIPLSLLFAVSMMRLFGVSGNLMSLGAIDFGLIVDGAVIIVEAIVHRLQLNSNKKKLSLKEMDQQVYKAASNIRSSAAFGEIIILIVYLPILSLVGIEGKMFAPMAQTVAFAIFGAFILSLTYVPMMSALLLRKANVKSENLSDRIIAFIQKLYTPVLNFSMKYKLVILIFAIELFLVSIYAFSKLGGEFIPTLSEGDIATHVMIPPGSSLSQEIETTTKAEKLLMDNFPEIEQIISKIGSAEVPTDPMPFEVADVMIILKEKSEWTSAKSKEEMFVKMEEVLDDLPGVTTEFSQPIQMRFNELMTGVRSDVGIKIFGDDTDLLVSYGDQLEDLVQNVSGVENARAETVSGLPQITVNYNRDKLALYGLTVSDLNQTISMGFAGRKSGIVYEQEKKYDLVVRLAKEFRQDIDNINNLYVTLPSGNQIPLEQVAEINFKRGPAQISREDGKRRITVGFNVRNRDVESVVEEIQAKIDEQLKLPVGYYITYTGQFENLKRAKNRLSVAVPLALFLIFILLYFTFRSIKQSLLIFTAIPLSAIGGVFALWLRSMPFSISAGIGFIALFGVAVLNGIVLIAYFNQLKSEGMKDIIQRIKVGTSVRLRPVIMTAAVASLGFLPMALSTSAGAEVQKPLATVVIGGLITATLLTLIVLPILYYYSERKISEYRNSSAINLMVLFFMSFSVFTAQAQNSEYLNLEEFVEIAIKNNPGIQAKTLEIDKQNYLTNGSYIFPKTEFEGTIGQLNTNSIDQSYSVSQKFNPFLPGVKKKLALTRVRKSESDKKQYELEFIHHIKNLWNQYQYISAKMKLMEKQSKLYEELYSIAQQKYNYGETGSHESSMAKLSFENLKRKSTQLRTEASVIFDHLKLIANQEFQIDNTIFETSSFENVKENFNIDDNPILKSLTQDIELAKVESKLMQADNKPELMLGYFIQSFKGPQLVDNELINYDGRPRFQGVNFGLSFALFRNANRNIEKYNETEVLIKQKNIEQSKLELKLEVDRMIKQYEIENANIQYYQNEALPYAELLKNNTEKAYQSGAIEYSDLINALSLLYNTNEDYLTAIYSFNKIVYDIQLLSNN